ncbi:hydrogen gas-evolving membrane-bound hydrogenase subunit E [Mangrovivirga cuniculi]|uniref:DUF4040 domain-containing protein n=1 Tax=Mangrovivirga cuniculi TaxID=2715131 RepID=A0A4D7JVD6_9BACT|nr:hydrogen gas-evolving membrane-bound hydrogenase subunit E [Mangrovivirga cuniculi]QCK16522.1 hypothetical protein DCC35_18185 [Mangrovivirga cuniculi]
MLISIFLIFLASLITSYFYKKFERGIQVILSALTLGIIIYYCTFIAPVSGGETFTFYHAWVDSLNIHLSFYIDGLSLFFTLLISIFGLLVLLYSFKYMEEYKQRNRFFGYLLFFMGSMLGLVQSSNLISLFIFWELTSFSSFLLIGFNAHKEESRRAARQALLVTAGGGLALMAGFIFLEIITNSGFNLVEILNSSDKIVDSSLAPAALVLIAIGAISKSAQFPLHFWLPNAMAAPTPVSAYLHSATMVKAGVYLIFRLNPIFQDIPLWGYLIGITGAVTMTFGAFKAFQEDDLKRILAYTTISALGIFFMMTGAGGKEAFNAVILYVLAHALYKGGLFLTAGSIDHQAGTRNVSQLSDLSRKMPYTSIALTLCFASMAGIIPFIGFVGKESLYEVLYHSNEPLATVYLVLLFIAGALFTAISIDVVYNALLVKGKLHDKKISEAKFLMVLSPLVLATGGFIMGLIPGVSVEPLLKWASVSIYPADPSMKLKLWHGFNFVLLLSVLTIFTGVGIYFIRKTLIKFTKPELLKADFWYDKTIQGIGTSSRVLTDIVQNGYLRNYVSMVIMTFSIIIILVLIKENLLFLPALEAITEGMEIYEIVIISLITIAVIILFNTKSRLIVTATFGIIGYSIALAYTLFSAPDVAITQFLAETLTLILLILILHKLPAYTLKRLKSHRKYLPIAVVFGSIMTFISYTMLNYEKDSDLKTFFLEKSISEGKGENAVNVILVDFRALDTLGEITVLTITMIGIIALLRVQYKKRKI